MQLSWIPGKQALQKARSKQDVEPSLLQEINQELKADLENGLIDAAIVEKQNKKTKAAQLDLPFIELSKLKISPDVLKIVPERIALKYKIVPFAVSDKVVKVATANAYDAELIEVLEKKTGRKLQVHKAEEIDIIATLGPSQKTLQEVIDDLIQKELKNVLNLTNDLPIIHIIDTIISYAQRDKSSDIHIEAEEGNVLVRFRIDGILHDVLTLDKSLHSSLVTRIKVLANLRIDEHLVAQDGKIRMPVDGEALDIRVSIIPTTEGEKVVLRLLSSKSRSFSLESLGMRQKDLVKVERATRKSHGMILSTGPTGSGKTTSIYSLIKLLNTREVNIMTIEDPVEYRIKGVSHIPVNVRTGLTFAAGLRSLLRQDPNVIFVGEIRDAETAGLAINASLTGHLVLSTLHTNDAATALPRLIDMQVEPFLIASTVNLILAQRLVRRICLSCKKEITHKRAELGKHLPEKIIKKYFGNRSTITTFKGSGCRACRNTGYEGRVGIFEVLEVTDTIRELITERSSAAVINKAAKSEGMVTLLDDGMSKVLDGQTTLDEVLRVMKIENI